MSKAAIRSYAPQARRDFIQAVTDRAAHFGLTQEGGDFVAQPMTEQGDTAAIGGRHFPRAVVEQRKALEARVQRDGFDAAMEALAYTWFDRLVAIRYLELHDYLENGEGGASYRVLSHPEGKPTPEILERADRVELPGLERQRVIDLKLDGKEQELYRLLLIAQCNALHAAMPFLFERIEDETELVLPENLLHTDGLIRKLVAGVEEADWREEVEVIGWIYEAYISERYEAVIGKVVASEDIPAATQKFTPKWVVKYLVHNTLGRLWLSTYPGSPLKAQLRYYIEPAEQAPDVREELRSLTPASLNLEEITFLDPACGSGHILVVAYDLFKAIYQERGYRAKDIPSLILRNNLFGLEIDDRAAQLASFAVMMKARADDRRIFAAGVQPNVVSIRAREGATPDAYVAAEDITNYLNEPVLTQELPPSGKLFDDEDGLFTKKNLAAAGDLDLADVTTLVELFREAKTVGSMIRVPPTLAEKLQLIEERARLVAKRGEGFARILASDFIPFVVQAKLLARRYDCVVANPPYMGSKYYNPILKKFVGKEYKDAKSDLYACFIQRNCDFTKPNGFVGMITIPNWMFLSSFEEMRKPLFVNQTIDSFVHNGRGVFGSDFGSCSFVLRNHCTPAYRATFRRLFEKQGSVASNEELEQRFHTAKGYTPANADFATIPGSPVAYWVSDALRNTYTLFKTIGDDARKGLSTGDNEKYVRRWWEIAWPKFSIKGGKTWFPVTKGGEFRRWYGNHLDVLDYERDGKRMQNDSAAGLIPGYSMKAKEAFFQPGVTWSDVSVAFFSARYVPPGFIPMDTGPLVTSANPMQTLAALNSEPIRELLSVSSSGVHFSVGHVARIPLADNVMEFGAVEEMLAIAQTDWNSFETSWDFEALTVLRQKAATLQQAQEVTDAEYLARFQRMKALEEENNRLFITAYGLQDELSPEVPDEQITLYRPDRSEDVKRLLSYIVGCAMGRYSLDQPGLVYAHGANVGFDPAQYKTFPADEDGIVPLLDIDWGFADDAVSRVVEFVGKAWPKESMEANLRFLADGLEPKKNEPARTTVRRYLAGGFYKDHLRWYKRRPIYWLFSSGKERAFQALVYLHRYHVGTLARMRTEYVIPLQGKVAARIDQLEGDKAQAASTSHRRKLQKEQDDLKKQQAELLAFDEKLRHAADQRIALDLDDGVKVNYGKFGDLLAEIKAVCGTKEDD